MDSSAGGVGDDLKTQKQAARASNSEPRAVCASVWVGNLNWDITEAHLRRTMAMFIGEPIGLHGPIHNAKMFCCHAMVDFATHAEASELLKHCAAPHNAQDPWVRVSHRHLDISHTTDVFPCTFSTHLCCTLNHSSSIRNMESRESTEPRVAPRGT